MLTEESDRTNNNPSRVSRIKVTDSFFVYEDLIPN